MPRVLDENDSRLLNLIQAEVPLVERPFAEIASRAGIEEAEVIERIIALKAPPKPLIRQISAIFDSKALGYESTLVAAKIQPARLEAAAAIISRHPGVSHNYERNHAFNLWYTLAVGPDSQLHLHGTIDALHRLSGASATRMFPTLRLFKIGVKFDLGSESESEPSQAAPQFRQSDRDSAARFAPTDANKRLVRVLQQDLPVISRPFNLWAQEVGLSVSEVLAAGQEFVREKQMRRFSAVLRHREAGFSANGMGVWAVPPEKCEAFGTLAAGFSAVSHCYQRPTYPDWPYSIFTMVHGRTQEECQGVLKAISQATGISEFSTLFSAREFKKTRVQYFTADTEAWEREAIADPSSDSPRPAKLL